MSPNSPSSHGNQKSQSPLATAPQQQQPSNPSTSAETRYTHLFQQLDVNGDGRIDIHDLSHALRARRSAHFPNAAKYSHGDDKNFNNNKNQNRQHGDNDNNVSSEDLLADAREFLQRSDLDESGDVSMEEFIEYAKSHEKRLKLIFTEIDRNNDGKIDGGEVLRVLREEFGEGVVSEGGVAGWLERMSTATATSSSSTTTPPTPSQTPLEISWEDFRDFLLLSPHVDSLSAILKYWRHSTMLDVGEPTGVPDDFTKDELQSGVWWRHLVAGGIAGAVSRTATAPLDRMKVWLQVHGTPTTKLYGILKAMLAEGGFTSLWRGNGINVLKIAPESAFKFLAYEQGKRLLKGNSDRELRIEERFLAGSVAGAVAQTIIYPLEVVKTRLALRRTGQYPNLFALTSHMYRTTGLRSFYRGYIPNLLGILPYAGIDLAVYETLKKQFVNKSSSSQNQTPNVLVLLTCGTASSACGQIASYPLALVRTRLQASTSVTMTMSGVFRGILERDGLGGLYRGIFPNFLKVAPAVSISWVVYEKVRVSLGVEMT